LVIARLVRGRIGVVQLLLVDEVIRAGKQMKKG